MDIQEVHALAGMSDEVFLQILKNNLFSAVDVRAILSLQMSVRQHRMRECLTEENIMVMAGGNPHSVDRVIKKLTLRAQLLGADDETLMRAMRLLCQECSREELCSSHAEEW